MNRLSVNLLIHSANEEKYFSYFAASLRDQTFRDFTVLVVDNNTPKKTVDALRRELMAAGLDFRIITQAENTGFAAGHNTAWQNSRTPYVLLLNPDMYLPPDTLEKLVEFMDNHPAAASVAPRLMYWDFDRVAREGNLAGGFSDRVDALGIRLLRNRRAIEMSAGCRWDAGSACVEVRRVYGKKFMEVFGVSGALAMLRRETLEKIFLPGGFLFDPLHHSYKEDLDLAYRLRNAGYLSFVLLDVAAYHDRTSSAPVSLSDYAAIKNKKAQSAYVRYHSYKNHLMTLYKNEYWQNILLDWPFILWFELRKAGYLLLTDPGIFFRGWWAIFHERSYLRAARRAVLRSRKMYWKGIRRWFYL